MLLMAEMIFHLTFEHGLKNGAKNLLQDVLYVFRALDVVVVEDLLSNLLAWGSWWSFTLCHSVTVLIFVYPSMGHKVDSCNTDLHKLFYTPPDFVALNEKGHRMYQRAPELYRFCPWSMV